MSKDYFNLIRNAKKINEDINSILSNEKVSIKEKQEETTNYNRTRLEEPNTCKEGSFRTKTVNDKGDKIVLCKDEKTGKLKAQSKLKKKKITEKIRREIIRPNRKFVYDEMEDETGMNVIECEGMASLGTSPTAKFSVVKSENKKGKKINEIASERYLSVEYNEAHPEKQLLTLYYGPAVMDSVELNLKDPLHTNAQEIRDIAKQHFDNITDDIRVAWF